MKHLFAAIILAVRRERVAAIDVLADPERIARIDLGAVTG